MGLKAKIYNATGGVTPVVIYSLCVDQPDTLTLWKRLAINQKNLQPGPDRFICRSRFSVCKKAAVPGG